MYNFINAEIYLLKGYSKFQGNFKGFNVNFRCVHHLRSFLCRPEISSS